MKKIIFIVLALVFVSFFFRIIYVYDGSIANPESGVTINFAYKSGGFLSSNSSDLYYSTNKFGFSIFRAKVSNFDIGVYDKTRAVFTQHFSDFTKIGPLVLINMNKLKQRPVVISKDFQDYHISTTDGLNRGLDVLSLIDSDNTTSTDFDFLVYEDTNTYKTKIMFLGKGGIQKIETSNTNSIYPMFNFGTAPEDGYQSQLEIKLGEQYVAKLRDGEHYMIMSFNKKFGDVYAKSDGTHVFPECTTSECSIKINILANPESNRKLDFSPMYSIREKNIASPGHYYQ